MSSSADRDSVDMPTVVLTFPLEGRLRISDTCRNEGDVARLKDWLRSRPEFAQLVSTAARLERQEAA